MNDRLMDLLDSYESYSSFARETDAYSFTDLFVAPDAHIYCDYVSSPYFNKELSLDKYLEYSLNQDRKRVRISNLKKSDYTFLDGRWHVKVFFDKFVEYEDRNGVVFSSSTIGGDYRIVMDCFWNPEEERFSIESISGTKPTGLIIPDGHFAVIEKRNEVDSLVRIGKDKLIFNKDAFAFLPSVKDITLPDDNYSLKVMENAVTDIYSLYSLNVRHTPIRARLRFSMLPFGAYRMESTYEQLEYNSNGGELTAEAGYSLSLAPRSKLVFSMGAGLSTGTISMNADGINYSYDIDGKGTVRTYSLDRITESIELTDFVIPAYISFEQGLGKKLGFVLDLGTKLYLNMSSKLSPYHITGSVDGIEFDEDYSQFISPSVTRINQFSVSCFGRTGICYNIVNGLFASLNAGYEWGLTDTYSPSVMTPWYDENGIYPLVFFKETDVPLHSFLSSISYRRNGFIMDFGFLLKF